MRFDIVTIFPDFFTGFLQNGILRRAIAEERVQVVTMDLRAFTHDRHRTVDDRPFGGGEGMVLKAQPIAEALESLGIGLKEEPDVSTRAFDEALAEVGTGAEADLLSEGSAARLKSCPDTRLRSIDVEGRPTVILLSAQGRPFTQVVARDLAQKERVVLICGRYEGVDERINELYCDMELSIGDYILSGGELAAAVVIDVTMRLIPGVLGNAASGEFESFGAADSEIDADVDGIPRSQHGAGGLLDYPHYTRPAEFGGVKVPEPLLNGDHIGIRRWRREQQLRKTLKNRPDLLEKAALSNDDRKLLERLRQDAASAI